MTDDVDFQINDRVIVTNDYGIVWGEKPLQVLSFLMVKNGTSIHQATLRGFLPGRGT